MSNRIRRIPNGYVLEVDLNPPTPERDQNKMATKTKRKPAAKTHGGKRAGAGRPITGPQRVGIHSVSVEPMTWNRWKRYVKKSGRESLSAMIREFVDDGVKSKR